MPNPKTTAGTAKFYQYAWLWFALALAITIIGFLRSFISKFTQTDLAHHFHAGAAMGWMVMLIAQPFLYSRDKLNVHRMLGRFSLVLAPLLVISGLLMMHIMLSAEGGLNPFTYMISFLDTIFLVQFIFFYVQAIRNRRNTQLHARYMAGTVLALLTPGLGRATFLIPGMRVGTRGFDLNYVILEIVCILLIFDDSRKGKIYPPYVIALLFLIFQHITLHYAGSWSLWQRLMQAFAAI